MSNEPYINMVDSGLFRSVRLPDPDQPSNSKVAGLLYAKSGTDVIALASNAVHKIWYWEPCNCNPYGMCSASGMPQLWQPPEGILLTNDLTGVTSCEGSVTRGCLALFENDCYLFSASGGQISLFKTLSFDVKKISIPPSTATCIAFLPQDNNTVAIGMEDSTIVIYNALVDKDMSRLKGHEKPITGIAFSSILNVLVSAGEDAQLCVWNIDGWVKKETKPMQAPPGCQLPLAGETKIQFHTDETHLLVIHKSQISVYDSQLECLRSWYPRGSLSAPISSAIYSCNGRLVFTGFCDGAVGVFDADNFRLRCRIGPSAYLSSTITSSGVPFPMVIAAHPFYSNQIALGMSDGSVYVIEPSDTDSKWGNEALGSALPRHRHIPQSAAPAA